MHPLVYLLPVAGYLYGAVPFGFLAARLIKGVDIRQTGSGNIGATNAARALGWKYFPPVFLLDFSKGFLPALAASIIFADRGHYDPHPMVVVTAMAAILGHVYPVYLGFKGGKAVATGTGVCLLLAPEATLIALGVWVVVFAVWRYVSLASISAAVSLAAGSCLLTVQETQRFFGAKTFLNSFCILAAALIIARHRTNILRLIRGAEHKIGTRRPRAQPGDEKSAGDE